MRALLLGLLVLSCSGGGEDGDDEGGGTPAPTCEVLPAVAARCQGLGYREGRACNPTGRDDGTWPGNCTIIENDPGRIDICCP